MTVKELIEELKKQRQDSIVCYGESKLLEVTEVNQIDNGDLVEIS